VVSDRAVNVAPGRLEGWIARFAERHGTLAFQASPAALLLTAPDGATARLVNRWLDPVPNADDPVAAFIAHATRPRRVGLLLARKSAHAIGVAVGDTLELHRVDTHYIQGRTKAGGWSQQRYARRRGNQASRAFSDAADDVAELLVPRLGELEGIVCGGDRTAITAVLEGFDAVNALRTHHPVLPTPDPRLVVLTEFASEVRKVAISLNELA